MLQHLILPFVERRSLERPEPLDHSRRHARETSLQTVERGRVRQPGLAVGLNEVPAIGLGPAFGLVINRQPARERRTLDVAVNEAWPLMARNTDNLG